MTDCIVRSVFINLELFLQKAAAFDIFEALIFNYKIKSSDWLEPFTVHFGNVVSEFSKQLEETLHAFYAQRLVQLQREDSASHNPGEEHESSLDSYDDPLAVQTAVEDGKPPATKLGTHQLQTFTCELCSRKFLSVAKLSAHLSRCHRNKENSRCNSCQFPSHSELQVHKAEQTRAAPQKLAEDDHQCLQALPFLCCRTCVSVHKTLEDFNAHVCVQSSGIVGECAEVVGQQLITNADQLKSLRKYKCGLCREEYRSQRRMLYHLGRCRQGPYRCELCPQEFHFKKDLNQHKKKSHRGAKCFFCDECSLAFKLCTSLQKHKVNRHESEQGPFPCDQCSQHFTKKIHLTNHKIRMHKIDRKFLCQVCGHKFSNSNSLNTHLKMHSEKKRFRCSYCKKMFRQKEKLKYHTRIHTGEKPHLCQTCGKSFIRKSQLDDHVLRHQGKKRHQCAHCSKTYAGLWDLKQHLKKKHSSPEEPGPAPSGGARAEQKPGPAADAEACPGEQPAGAGGAELPGGARLVPVVQPEQLAGDGSRIIVHLGTVQPLSADGTLHLLDGSSVVQVVNQPAYLLACAPAIDIPTITY